MLFGHFGDRIGRKATLVAALMTMGLSTVAIGLLPSYAQIGIVAPLLLALCRLGQGLGLGGEWGGAVLLATENAPAGKEAWYGMFPQLGAPIGFILATGSFLLLSDVLSEEQFFAFGWRIPFIASALLVFIGLWMRLKISETPAFGSSAPSGGMSAGGCRCAQSPAPHKKPTATMASSTPNFSAVMAFCRNAPKRTPT